MKLSLFALFSLLLCVSCDIKNPRGYEDHLKGLPKPKPDQICEWEELSFEKIAISKLQAYGYMQKAIQGDLRYKIIKRDERDMYILAEYRLAYLNSALGEIEVLIRDSTNEYPQGVIEIKGCSQLKYGDRERNKKRVQQLLYRFAQR